MRRRRRHGPPGSYPNEWPISHGGRYGVRGCLLRNDQSSLHDTTIYIKCPSGGTLTILWGDGSASSVTCNNTLNSYAHTYSATGQYVIRIVGTTKMITALRFQSQAWIGGDLASIVQGLSSSLTELYAYNTSISGDLSALSRLTGLSILILYYTNVSGSLSSISSLTGLTTLYINNLAGVVGDIGSIRGLTALTGLRLYSSGVSDYTAGALPAWPGATIYLYSQGLSSAEVDQFLVDFADGIGAAGTLKIAGTNAARTAASDAAKAAILAAGWTLEVNE